MRLAELVLSKVLRNPHVVSPKSLTVTAPAGDRGDALPPINSFLATLILLMVAQLRRFPLAMGLVVEAAPAGPVAGIGLAVVTPVTTSHKVFLYW